MPSEPPHRAGALDLPEQLTSVNRLLHRSSEANRFATAAFAMGPAGINFIEQLPGFEGYMIDPGGMATYTSGFERYVSHD